MAESDANGRRGAAARVKQPTSRVRRSPGVIDWAAIEKDYRAGKLTVATIERRHGIDRNTMYKRARRDGWPLRQPELSREYHDAKALRRLAERVRHRLERRLDRDEDDAAAEGRDHSVNLLDKLVHVHERIAHLERMIGADAERSGGVAGPLDEAGRAAVEDFLGRHGIELRPIAGWGGRAADGRPPDPA